MITIIGRQWQSRTYGTTYYTAEILVTGKDPVKTPAECGYGEQYLQTAVAALVAAGDLPAGYRYCGTADLRERGISWTSIDVARERDL